MKWNVSNWRPWLFRILVVVAAGLMVISFAMPWWTASIDHVSRGRVGEIEIYAHGLRHTLVQYASWMANDETPFYQTVIAWVYLAASVGLMFYSTWLKGKKGQLLLGGVGLIYIAYAVIAIFVVIGNRTPDFGVSLEGWSQLKVVTEEFEEEWVDVRSSLPLGSFLAYAAGGMCIALALLRGIIVAGPKSEHNNDALHSSVSGDEVRTKRHHS